VIATDLPPLSQLESRICPLRATLLEHPVYRQLDRLDALRTFMEHHVFAVWDFMSLLKALQRQLCCTSVPWLPAAHPAACRMINEIVLAEESDADGRGGYASHFELYRRAMRACGARTAAVDGLIEALAAGRPLEAALGDPAIPAASRAFQQHTFAVIERGDACELAAAFTFGREDLLPDVFQRIVDELDLESGGKLADFQYYLQRHIGLDGDEHGPMARQLLASLCGDDAARWNAATESAAGSLAARVQLWDAISQTLGR